MRIARCFAVLCIALAATPVRADEQTCDPPLRVDGFTAPVAIAECGGLRPGSTIDLGGPCVVNFVYTGSDGHRYMGAPGGCVLSGTGGPATGERVWSGGGGPIVRDLEGARIGEVAYAIVGYWVTTDYALIRLDDGVTVSTQIGYWGGPTAIADGSEPDGAVRTNDGSVPADMVVLRTYSRGTNVAPLDAPGHAGTMLTNDLSARHAVWAHAPDLLTRTYGAPVILDDGRALGMVLAFRGYAGENQENSGTITDYTFRPGGTIGITRLRPYVDRFETLSGVDLELETSDLR